MSNLNQPPTKNSEIWWSINHLVFTVMGFLFLSNFAALIIVLPMFDFNEAVMLEFLKNPIIYPQYKMAMLQMQGIISVITFIAAPMVYLKYIDNQAITVPIHRIENIALKPILWVLTPFIVIGFMPVDSWIVEFNQNMVLPESFKNIELWAKTTETQMQELTKYLTNFDNIVEFLAAIVVMAIVPAIGEELLFRGILQNKIELLAKNYHIAIWASAFIFSAIHFQFYGFIPRLLLGALFGYLYVWSGNLTIPIIAHFVNNAFTLTLIYVGVNIESTPSIEITVISLLLVISFVYLFKKIATENTHKEV
jgi:membrane protease YdiL (CAAX protease family)